MINDREENLSKIKVQRKQIQDKIKQKRDQINTHFDNLERKLVKELDAVEQSLTSQIGQLIGQLKGKSKVVKQLQHKLAVIKSHASDLQTFLGSKQLEKQADKEDKYIRSLVHDESLQTTDLKCTINEKIGDIAAVSTFGSVIIEKGPTSVAVHTEKDKQVQIMSPVRMHSGSVDYLQATSVRRFNLPTGKTSIRLTGCAISQNGITAFADNNQRIVITNDHGILQSEISVFPSLPFDVTCLDNNSVAVTSHNDKNIKIINTTSRTTTQTITATAWCDGITNRQGTLIYCERGEGIKLHKFDSKSSNTVVRQDIPFYTYVAANETNICHTNNASGTVTCYNFKGGRIWEFNDTSILKIPRGEAIDKHLNVYVASNGNNSIVVISPDGQKSREFLNENDGIKNPWGIAIDNERGHLMVTCFHGTILLYKLNV